jgi:hypothetical protein
MRILFLSLIISLLDFGNLSQSTKMPHALQHEGNYFWKVREDYYHNSLQQKIDLITKLDKCSSSVKIIEKSSIILPSDDSIVHMSEFPVQPEMFNWWAKIPRPTQMRVDPFICDIVYTKKVPIFNNTGCQLPEYMSPSAPRCQTQYLRWVCSLARIPIDSITPNYFVLPESDHSFIVHASADNKIDNGYKKSILSFFSSSGSATTPPPPVPPQPWLLTARNAFVSACGQLSLPCGTMVLQFMFIA